MVWLGFSRNMYKRTLRADMDHYTKLFIYILLKQTEAI
jgi:hypothetical protein